jgi:hypothetical protein
MLYSKERDNEPIDFIFIKGKWKVLQHATLSQTGGGRFSSDHFPVLQSLAFKNLCLRFVNLITALLSSVLFSIAS